MVVAAPPTSPATTYAQSVADGEIVAGPWVRLAAARHLRDLERVGDPDFPYRFDTEAEEMALGYAALMNLDAGVPFVAEDFQQFILGMIFGWLNLAGWRRFRTAYIEIGKGNGKSPLAAIIGIIGLCFDGETQAEILCAAVTREQAHIMLTDAVNIALHSESVAKRCDITKHNIAHGTSFCKAVSAEGRSLDGKRPHMALLDEIHEHRTDVVVQKMRAGVKRREQPLIFEITNSGYDRESICWRHHQHSIAVLEQRIDDETWLAYVCALDEGDHWLDDESCWPKANPGLGTILPYTYLREQVKEARNIPTALNLIARLNFCVWTQSVTKWLDVDQWRALELPTDRRRKAYYDLADLEGERAFGGLDLASTTDLSAFSLWFPEHEIALWWFWAPEVAGAKRAERDAVPYPLWAEQGWLTLTEGNITDYDAIEETIVELAERYDIVEIGYDRWNATSLVTHLVEDGAAMVPFGQGYASLSEPSKQLEGRVVGAKLRHNGNPVVAWMVGNVVVRQDSAGNIKPDREQSAEKIDGIVALLMALGRATLDEGAPDWWVT